MIDRQELAVIHTKNHYQSPKEVTWNDMIDKLSYEFDNDNPKFIIDALETFDVSLRGIRALHSNVPPTFVCHTDYYPGAFLNAFNEVKNYSEMHVYCSLGKKSLTFGNHKDDVDVLLVQSVGKITYDIEGKIYNLNPGDSLFIPSGTYHNPIITQPRITLSFSNE